MPPPASLDPRERCWGGSNDLHCTRRSRDDESLKPAPDLNGRIGHQLFVGAAHQNVHQRHMGWIGWRTPSLELARGKLLEVMSGGGHEGGVRRRARLHQNPAPGRPASRPAGDLRDQLEGSLGSPEIGQVKPGVRIDDAHQGDPGKIQTFGDHLRPEQNVHLAPLDGVEDPVVGPLDRCGVGIHPRQSRGRNALGEPPLQELRADSAGPMHASATLRTFLRNGQIVAAVVAPQSRRRPMHGQRDIAGRTLPNVTAARALKEVGKAAAVEEEEHLFTRREGRVNRFVERARPGNRPTLGDLGRRAQIDQGHGWKWLRCDPRRELHDRDPVSRCPDLK